MASPSADDSSYPPLFRHPSGHSAAAHGDPPSLPAGPIADLPVIDLRDIDHGALRAACREWGAFLLSNHGIPQPLARRFHEETSRLLSLPYEAKRGRFGNPAAFYFWGTPAVTLSVRNLNWIEGLHLPLGRLQPPPAGGDPGHDDSSYLRGLAEEYGGHSSRIVRALFDSLATELGFDGGRRASSLSDSGALLRLFRYPRCPDAGKHLGMDAHTDSSVLTVVSQDEVGGLQVLGGQTWFHVKPVPNTLVVNVGDMLQAMSDDEYKSVEHRVLASGSKERISICYFAFPEEDYPIRSSRYREFTYREFRERVQEDTRAVGFKVGLQRFKNLDSS